MVYTKDDWLPSEEELKCPEIKLTAGPLIASAHHLGKYCDHISKEFMLCWYETRDPRACLEQGKEVTACGLKFFQEVKKHCAAEFTNYYLCVDKRAGPTMPLQKCRHLQKPFDDCILENLKQERPPFGYFSKLRVHHTSRPKPVLKPAPMPERIPDLPDYDALPDPPLLKQRQNMPHIFR